MLLALLSRGESSFRISHPSRAVTSVFDALDALGLLRFEDEERAFVRGLGLGLGSLGACPPLDFRGEAAAGAFILAALCGRAGAPEVWVDAAVGDTLGAFLAEHGLAELEARGSDFVVRLGAATTRWPGFEAELSGAIPWLKPAYLALALRAASPSTLIEKFLSADHFERALFRARAPVQIEPTAIGIHPPRDEDALGPEQYEHIGSAYLASHLLVLPLLCPAGGEVTVRDVSSNRSSAEVWSLLRLLGADLRVHPKGDRQGEPVADVTLRASSPLRGGVHVAGEQALRIGDGILPLLPAIALGALPSHLSDLTFTRRDATPRILPRAVGFLKQAGFSAQIEGASVILGGTPGRPLAPLIVTTGAEPRLALLGGLLALTRLEASTIDDVSCLSHIYPRFAGTLRSLGGQASVQAAHAPFHS